MQRLATLGLRRSAGGFAALPLRSCATPGKIKVNIKTQDGTAAVFEAPVGISLMAAIRDVAKLEMDGACDGCMQCSTCHCYLLGDSYKRVGEADDAELDILEKALDQKDNSRLACQIQLTPELDGIEVELPANVTNLLM